MFAAVSDFVQSSLDGYHVCLFTYGQTGSGKSYTMIGDTSGADTTPAPGRGIIPRAVSMILEASARLGATGWSFHMEATFIEVYNEALRDLLAEGGLRGTGNDRRLDSAAIKHNANAHTHVRLAPATAAAHTGVLAYVVHSEHVTDGHDIMGLQRFIYMRLLLSYAGITSLASTCVRD